MQGIFPTKRELESQHVTWLLVLMGASYIPPSVWILLLMVLICDETLIISCQIVTHTSHCTCGFIKTDTFQFCNLFRSFLVHYADSLLTFFIPSFYVPDTISVCSDTGRIIAILPVSISYLFLNHMSFCHWMVPCFLSPPINCIYCVLYVTCLM
jgi:hypothetical protein